MAKAAILNVLEDTIGRYVQGLDAKSLNVAVWAGKIELQSLKLDVDAVNRELARQAAEAPNFALPFRVVDGSFASLTVDVPWARITSKPVVLRAAGLDCTIEPYDHLAAATSIRREERPNKRKVHSSETMNEKRQHDERLQSLELAEESRQRTSVMKNLAEMDDDDEEEGTPEDKSDQTRGSSSTGFKARLVRRIIENLQLEIDDMKFEMRGKGCNAGVTVDKFSIFTTDKDGKKSFIDRASSSQNIMKSFLYKALQLEGLAVYCDEDRSTPSYLKQPYKPMDDRYGKTCILSPLSFSARLRQSDCLKCVDFPKYLLSAELPTVSFRLTRTQLELVNGIANEINEKKHVARPLFPEYRPDVPISKKSAKLWWRYAVRSIGRITRRRSWTEFFIAYKKRKQYIALYKRLVYSSECSWLIPVTISDRAEIDHLERDKSVSTQGIMSWRTMADAQAHLEMKKCEELEEFRRTAAKATPKKKSTFRSLMFGKKGGGDLADRSLLESQSSLDDLDEAPISLSAAEMRELDSIVLESASDAMTLSSDSMLCDVSFEMGSFSIDLVTFASAPLVSLEMGAVLSSFKANADGSFSSSFSLSSLNVHDRITRNTLFPVIIRSLQSSMDSTFDTFKNAIEFKLTKARNGDQSLEACMVSYEIVACDVLLRELKKFATIAKESKRKPLPSNPLLQYSVSGGADLFYDADLDETTVLASTILLDTEELNTDFVPNNQEPSKVADKLSSAFADAWKSKLEKETVWSVQLNLHAPILVLPQSCTNPLATTLVIDLGTFNMTYGKQLSPEVKSWFFEGGHSTSDIKVDHCSIEMEHFSLTIAKAGQKDWLEARKSDKAMSNDLESVIEPVTLKLNVGVENGGRTRKCMFGVMEQISLSISNSQIVKMVSLLSFWADTAGSLSGDNTDAIAGIEILEEGDEEEAFVLSKPVSEKDDPSQSPETMEGDPVDLVHFSVVLQQFKATIVNDKDESVEAHLLSATAASTKCSDGSSSLHLQMGHFWILDHLKGDFPRRQRLVAHSRLPLPASTYAATNQYNILETFGVSERGKGGNSITSLADIKITKSARYRHGEVSDNPFLVQKSDIMTTTIDANFSTLYIHWNPYSIRNLLTFQRDLMSLVDRVKSIPVGRKSQHGSVAETIADASIVESMLVLNAKMEAFNVCLNSARDDLPLFQMTMSNTNVNIHSYKASEDNMMATVAVGDFRLEVPKTTKVCAEYCTILGLAPNHSSSLLQLQYGKGPLALKCCTLENFDSKVAEMFIVVNLSPMRFVHVQATVLTLVEYVTEGVLGAIGDNVMESAAQAAREMAEAETTGQKVFSVHAQGFDFVLPQAAYSSNHFVLQAGNLDVHFISFPAPGEGKARICLNEVTMKCNRSESIIEDPIVIDVQANLAPLSSPTPDEMATRIDINISRAAFVLTQNHYAQMMNTLDLNISELDPFLREDNFTESGGGKSDGNMQASASALNQRLTHGGVEEVIIRKRMYMQFKFEAICLELCNEDTYSPLIAVTALETDVSLRMLPDEDKLEFDVTLLDLVVEDRRLVAFDRQFRKLVQQDHISTERDVFSISYSKSKSTNTTTLDVGVGSPRIVFIPDAISDSLAFFETGKPPATVAIDVPKESLIGSLVAGGSTADPQQQLKTLDFTMKTDDCSFVLIDMGAKPKSQHDNEGGAGVETIVMKGKIEATAKMVSNIYTGSLVDLNFELHGDRFEFYAAEGDQLEAPVQILNPAKLSVFISTKTKDGQSITEFTFVSLSDFDIILSMRQYALLLAIAASSKDALVKNDTHEEESASVDDSLSEKATEKIDKLARALEQSDDDSSVSEARISRHSTTASQSSHGTKKANQRVIKIKFTLPNTNVTVVNDLQGVDEALFKVSVASFINNTELSLSEKKSDCIFHSHTFMMIYADYFNAHSNRWEKLLLRPWELDFKAVRGKKKNTRRKATTIDIESHPCQVSFSEQFIISLQGANAMWGVFSGTNSKAMALIKDIDEKSHLDKRSMSRRKSMASCAARALTTTLPYGVCNRSRIPITFITKDTVLSANDGATVYFRFPLTVGDGVGGYRLYGQDSKETKTVTVIVAEQEIVFNHIDDEVTKGKRGHRLNGGLFIFTEVEKTGKATIIHISSFMDVYNDTCLDFSLALKVNEDINPMGVCKGDRSFSQRSLAPRRETKSRAFGVESILLHEAYNSSATNRVRLALSPAQHCELTGDLQLPPFTAFRQMASGAKPVKTVEVVCSPKDNEDGDNLTICLVCKVTLVDDYPLVEIFLRPRLVVRNNLFVNILASTPMSRTFSKECSSNKEQGTDTHALSPFDTIEVFHAGSSVAFAYKCGDNPIGGNRTGWNKFGWIDMPLTLKSRLQENIRSSFPFLTSAGEESKFAGGCDFFLTEEGYIAEDKSKPTDGGTVDNTSRAASLSVDNARTISLSVDNLGVDHTGDILFESWDMNQQFAARGSISEQTGRQNFTFSSFASSFHKRRITILPKAENFLRIIHLSMDGVDGFRRSKPFCIADVAFCEGGVESSPIYWEDSKESGYYAYRKISSCNQSELHIIPEFVIFNGGSSKVRVTVQRCSDIVIDAGKMAITKRPSKDGGLAISVMFDGHKCASTPVQVDQIGLKVVMVRSFQSGSPVGSLAIQTVLGAKDSRFVIKLGDLKHGNIIEDNIETSLFHRDYLHCRIRWSQLEATLLDTSTKNDYPENTGSTLQTDASYRKVARFVLHRFTLDYQKLFKDDARVDAARTQFSAIIHNINVADCTTVPETSFLASVSEECNFLDLRLRTRGSGDNGLLKVDLLELKIAHGAKKADEVLVNTNEAFLWSLLDIASRANTAISEFTSTDTNVEWDEETESFRVESVNVTVDEDDDMGEDGTYRAPRSDLLLSVKKMYVWPSAFRVSFKRQPQSARYQQVKNVKSAKLVVYFMKKLNFTVDRARLQFAGFSCNNVKGPPDRIVQSVKAFYLAQMKKKLFSLLTATSIDEWRQLAGRDDGKESYVEGDILRMTGNLAGRSAGYLVKKVGEGLGKGFAAGTAEVGNGIQNVSEAMGVGFLGAGVNSLVSGIGEGVGNTVEGVGSGGNKIIQGAGKGVGQIIGGVGGGLQHVAAGIGKGVTTGDGTAILTGFGDGVTSIGTGVLKGTESVITGAAEGVFSVGKGLFSGVRSLGSNLGNTVQGKRPDRNRKPPSGR